MLRCGIKSENHNNKNTVQIRKDTTLTIIERLCGNWSYIGNNKTIDSIFNNRLNKNIFYSLNILCLTDMEKMEYVNELDISGWTFTDTITKLPEWFTKNLFRNNYSYDSTDIPIRIIKRNENYGFLIKTEALDQFVVIEKLSDSLLTLNNGQRYKKDN